MNYGDQGEERLGAGLLHEDVGVELRRVVDDVAQVLGRVILSLFLCHHAVVVPRLVELVLQLLQI